MTMIHVSRSDVAAARTKVWLCELELGRKLTPGERRDLLCDQFPSWASQYAREVVELLALLPAPDPSLGKLNFGRAE